MENYQELLDQLKRQEEELQFVEFTNETALQLGLQLIRQAKEEGKPITIDICRNGQQLFHCALAGTSADNDAWIKRKSNVVNRYGRSSYHVGTQYRAKGAVFEENSLLNPAEYAAHGGAFPIIIKNVGVVGSVTVSGLPQVEDHEFVLRVLSDFLRPVRERG
jgi:uncharacterized protein (UPF0303 family)